MGIDLADDKQKVVLTHHDSQVLARKTFTCKAWKLCTAPNWAATQAGRAAFGQATIAYEPTGHRWRVLGRPAAERGTPVHMRAAHGDVLVTAHRATPAQITPGHRRIRATRRATNDHADLLARELWPANVMLDCLR